MKLLPKEKEGMAYTYVLIDPRINKVRYVGTALNPRARFSSHISDAKHMLTETYKDRWIRKLLSLALMPRMVVLEENPIEFFEESEKWWIKYYRFRNGKLMTNATDGGDGWHGMHHSEKTKRRFSEWQTGRTLTPEHRKNIGLANLGRIVTLETREKQRVGNLGKIISEEHKNSLSKKAKKRMANMTKKQLQKVTEKARASIQKKRSGLSSLYRGVCLPKGGRSWMTSIRIPGGRNTNLGSYLSDIGAASAYNREARRLYGDKAILNDIPGGEIFESRAPKGNNKPRDSYGKTIKL